MKPLENQHIESMNYSVNTVADLKMRFDLACEALELIQENIKNEQPEKAYEIAVNELARITSSHDRNCSWEVELNKETNKYDCECSLHSQLP